MFTNKEPNKRRSEKSLGNTLRTDLDLNGKIEYKEKTSAKIIEDLRYFAKWLKGDV